MERPIFSGGEISAFFISYTNSSKLRKKALNKANVKNYYTCNNCQYHTYKPSNRENVYIYKIVNYIMSVN